jgi:hypothetical protein
MANEPRRIVYPIEEHLMQKGHELPAGTTVAFSTGCYSDYSVGPFAKLLKPMNEAAWAAMVADATRPSTYWPDGFFQSEKAIEWLRENGYIEEVEYVELHLGDYGYAPSWEEA